MAFQKDVSWDEHFAVPGDLSSGIADARGTGLLVPALGRAFHESGLHVGTDDTFRGLFTTNDPASVTQLCDLLVG